MYKSGQSVTIHKSLISMEEAPQRKKGKKGPVKRVTLAYTCGLA